MTIELYDASRNYAASTGHLTYRGGPLLHHAKLYGVYFDDFPFQQEMSTFLDWYGTSSLVSELAEYNVVGPATHPADFTLSLAGTPKPPPVPTPPPPVPTPPPVPHHRCPPGCKSVHHRSTRDILRQLEMKYALQQARSAGTTLTDGDIQKLLSDAIVAGTLPKPDASTLFVTFYPEGVTVDMGTDASCSSFCGYHSNFELPDRTETFYAVLPFPSCSGCTGGLSPLRALTATTSHEISEALTDPIPGTAWYDDVGGEIGDICAWQFRTESGYNVQLEWSNSKNMCI